MGLTWVVAGREGHPEALARRLTTAAVREGRPELLLGTQCRTSFGIGHRRQAARRWHARAQASALAGEGASGGAATSIGQPRVATAQTGVERCNIPKIY